MSNTNTTAAPAAPTFEVVVWSDDGETASDPGHALGVENNFLTADAAGEAMMDLKDAPGWECERMEVRER